MNTRNDPAIRSALYLNNTGVYLLEKGFEQQAIASLRDAISIISRLAKGATNTGDVVQQDFCQDMLLQDVRAAISLAEQRLAGVSTCLDHAVSERRASKKRIVVFSHQELPFSSISHVLHQSTSSEKLSVIPLFHLEYFAEGHSAGFDAGGYVSTLSAFMLFNYAMAFRCHSMKAPLKKMQLEYGAFRLLELSMCALQRVGLGSIPDPLHERKFIAYHTLVQINDIAHVLELDDDPLVSTIYSEDLKTLYVVMQSFAAVEKDAVLPIAATAA